MGIAECEMRNSEWISEIPKTVAFCVLQNSAIRISESAIPQFPLNDIRKTFLRLAEVPNSEPEEKNYHQRGENKARNIDL
jgi:hypothetical protein